MYLLLLLQPQVKQTRKCCISTLTSSHKPSPILLNSETHQWRGGRKRKLEQQIFQNKECEQVLQVVNYTTASHPLISFCQWLSLLRNTAWFIYMTQDAERVFMFGFVIHFSICSLHFSSLHINIRSYLMLSQTFVFSSAILTGLCWVAAAIQDVPY